MDDLRDCWIDWNVAGDCRRGPEGEVVPWTAKDASSKTKKAKSPAAKKQWKAIANSVLAKTGNDATAIKMANAVIKRRKK